MKAFEISDDDAVVWKRIWETASGAAFECALKLFAREAPLGRYGSGLPAARNDGVRARGKSDAICRLASSLGRLWGGMILESGT